jgi:hypothetical protein
MDFMIVSKMQMDFKLQVDQSKLSLQRFHHFKWCSNYKPTNPNELCNYLTHSNGLIPIFQAIPGSGYIRTCSNGLCYNPTKLDGLSLYTI